MGKSRLSGLAVCGAGFVRCGRGCFSGALATVQRAAIFLIGCAISMSWCMALPSRLVLLLDGVPYHVVKALQDGTESRAHPGKRVWAFQHAYYPASRLIATFPSISDVSWTEIMGDDPPPGYQRTFFRSETGSEVCSNGVAGLLEYEEQMSWHLEGNFRRTMSYSAPMRTFRYELNSVMNGFLQSDSGAPYYALFQGTDIAQHSWGDVQLMLCMLDEKLEQLRAIYRAREGKELEILILSDHGNDGAGRGRRVGIKSFLRKHGYHVGKRLSGLKDVVLPTAGIESWVELHNLPGETLNLLRLLPELEGVDLVTALDPNRTNGVMVRNFKGQQAEIEWKGNSFRYVMNSGDPLDYERVVTALASRGALDREGFATADAWMKATLNHYYPLALERIVRGHTRVARNPASILVSLRPGYVHSGWLLKKSLDLAKSGGTHGALDSISSTGVLLSNFEVTSDSSSSRVAALFDGFKGRSGRGKGRADELKIQGSNLAANSAGSKRFSAAH